MIGIDIGKNAFHVIGLNTRGSIVLKAKLSRTQLARKLANLPRCLVGMEACVGAHHLSHRLIALGHDARLMPLGYREIEQQLRTEALAALAILARSDVEALKRLLRALAPEDVCFQIEAMLTAERPGVIALRGRPPMQLALVAELFRTGESRSAEVAAFASDVRRARASVQQVGFRKQSEADPEWSKAFAASADALARLLGELRRLLDHFERHPGAMSPGADAERFAAVLRMLYR